MHSRTDWRLQLSPRNVSSEGEQTRAEDWPRPTGGQWTVESGGWRMEWPWRAPELLDAAGQYTPSSAWHRHGHGTGGP